MKNFFSIPFFAFSKFLLNFKNFQKKDYPHSWFIFERMDSEKRGSTNV